MKGRYFLDTNILIYGFENQPEEKCQKAEVLIEAALQKRQGLISFQVVQECINVLTRKAEVPASNDLIRELFDTTLKPLCRVQSSFDLYRKALDVKTRWQFGFYDSLIIAAALLADCRYLYSEDMQHNQLIEDLRIINPFGR